MGRICQDKHGPVHGHALHAAIFHGKNKILHKLLESHHELIEDKFIPAQGSNIINFTPILLAISISGDKVEILKTEKEKKEVLSKIKNNFKTKKPL